MSLDLLLNSFLSNPYLNSHLSNLKTDKWESLSSEDRLNVYDNINKSFCSFLNIDPYTLNYDDLAIRSCLLPDSDLNSSNVIKTDRRNIQINNIYLNQYSILYDYFYLVISDFQRKLCKGKYNKYVDEKVLEKWRHDIDCFSFGNIVIDNYDENDLEYSSIVLDAKKYSEKLIIAIIKNNFNYKSSFKEEEFLSRTDLFVNSSIVKRGKSLSKNSSKENIELKQSLINVSNKINNCRYLKDLSKVNDNDLFMIVYPGVYDNVDKFLIVKLCNEVLKRIYDDSVTIEESGNRVIVNGHSYRYSNFTDNIMQVLLCECMYKMENDLKNSNKFLNSSLVKEKGLKKALIETKKDWVENVINKVDHALAFVEFGVLKYQPLSRLYEPKNLDEYLNKNTLRNKGGR